MLAPRRTCTHMKEDGQRCGAPPLRGEDRCFWHSPEHVEEAAAARKLGGQRRRREGTLSGAYDFEDLSTVEGIRRLLYIAAYDALSLDNSVARCRTIIACAQAAAKLLHDGELEGQLQAIAGALSARTREPTPAFDLEVEAEEELGELGEG